MQIYKHAVLMALCFGCGAAVAWQPPTTSQVKDDCELYKISCVRHWADMSAAERARLWPYLDEVTRNLNWRVMTNKERQAMRDLLPQADKEALRHRFASKEDDASRVRNGTGVKHINMKRLCVEDRTLMREQIREFHVERVSNRSDHPAPSRTEKAIMP